MHRPCRRLALAAIAALATVAAAEARVVRLETVRQQSPNFDGRVFGDAGAYEKIVAKAQGELDPADRRNARIADIALAPRNARGLVEYTAEVHILKPVDAARGNGRLFVEILNRGNKLGTRDFHNGPTGAAGNDPTAAADAGDGFLFRRGYAVAWIGWQSGRNVPAGANRMTATIPIARNADGSTIRQTILFEQIFDHPTANEFELIFPASSVDTARAHMTVRSGSADARVEVPAAAWSFVSPTRVRVDRTAPALARYDAGAAYELVYEAHEPEVSGIGYAITRDVTAFLRHESGPENPLRGAIRYALSQGTSQSGRMLKGFLQDGFNEDEAGRLVFDGVQINVSGAHGMELNQRFGDANATGRAYQRHTSAKLEFPFTYGVATDPLTGRSDGILKLCSENRTCPKVIHTDGGNEYWGKAAMLVTTDGRGNDIELPENVRVFFYASTQHGPARSADRGICQHPGNPNRWEPHQRALFLALDAWATAGVAPPESRFPRASDGTLAPALPRALQGFPELPGLRYTGVHNTVGLLDATTLPRTRVPGKDYVVLVPRVDADGNDIAGLRSVDVQVPLGTLTGWALRRAGFAENEECSLQGQFVAFAPTRAARLAAGDPRLSLEERYRNAGDYVTRVALAAEALVRDRLLVREDADAIVAAAAARGR